MRRKRLSQEWVRSTTQRRARKPASCLIACASSPRPRMWGEGELLAEVAHLGVVVAAIEAEPLRLLRCRRRSHDRDRLDRGPAELEVIQVRARRRDPERDACTLGEERSFRPFLLYQWDWPRSARRPTGPYRARRPSPATPTRSPAFCRRRAALAARTRGTRRRRPTRESADRPDEQLQIPVALSAPRLATRPRHFSV